MPPVSRLTSILLVLLLGCVSVASSQIPALLSPSPTPYALCQRFNTLYVEIREQTIVPDSARAVFSQVMQGLRSQYHANANFPDTNTVGGRIRTAMSFPLQGYASGAIGGSHGEGYRSSGFDLFDYKVRGSHPAQDIFIRDQNQDCIDDRTGAPVAVLAMGEGLVLAVETGWTPGQEYRGGNWIWVYDPVRDGLFYYAHNNVVNVAMGDWVQAGQKLGEVGRTGLNAYKARSPTHLHLMYLQLQPSGLPEPKNTYGWLLTAKK